MIKKITLVLAALSLVAGLRAETLLNDGFEDWSAVQFPAEGWSVINDTQEGTVSHWMIYTGLSGKNALYCDGGSFDPVEPVKEEWIISPELTLGDTNYNLSFLWQGAWVSASKKEYDLQVRVTADDGKTWDTIFSFLDQEDVENSGVVYPWSAWQPHSSLLSLKAYAGKTIKIAFVHCLLVSEAGAGNSIWIDDVLVESGEAIDQPIASVTPASYIFDGTYIGVGKWSEKFALSNTGVGTLTVSGVSGLEGTDFSTNLNPADVSIKPGAEYEFYVKYTPSSAMWESAPRKMSNTSLAPNWHKKNPITETIAPARMAFKYAPFTRK